MMTMILAVLLSGTASARCTVPESMPALNERMAGEGDADWCLEGADPFAIAGPDLQPFRQLVWDHRDADVVSIIQWRRGEPDAAPASWRTVFTRPATDATAGEFREILVQKLADNLIVVTSNPAWRIGNAVCAGEGGTSIGYVAAGVSLTAADRDAIEGMAPDKSRMDPGNIMCTLLIPDGDAWRGTFRGPQGRPLPEMEDFLSGVRMRATAPGDYEQVLVINR